MNSLKQICPYCQSIMMAKVEAKIEEKEKTEYWLRCTVCSKQFKVIIEYPLFNLPTKK